MPRVEMEVGPVLNRVVVGFREYSDMRKLLREVLSFTLLPEQIQGLRKEFEKYDKDTMVHHLYARMHSVIVRHYDM
jgi:calcium-dependent protein kinase